MSTMRESIKRLFNRSETDVLTAKNAQAIGSVGVKREVAVTFPPSVNDLDSLFGQLSVDARTDPALSSLYQAAKIGALPVSDVMQYARAYEQAVHHDYGSDNRETI